MTNHQVHRADFTPRDTLTVVFRGVFAFALLAASLIVTTAPAAAATVGATTTCSNGVDNAGGKGLICDITVVNSITASGGSARVTVHECHGAAGAPTALCSTKTTNLVVAVTAITQCNGSSNGGGGTLRCTIVVTNNFYGGFAPGASAATVNQCVGSGDGLHTGCDPFPATTSGAAITQCNGSANGGTLVQLTCHATGTMAAAHGVTMNQCNGSGLGGGGLVICSASVASNVATGTPPPTSTFTAGSSNTSTPSPVALLIWFALGVLGLAVVEARRRSIHT